MRFSVDAHAIGQHLTGNEVYIRNLLNGFAALDETSDFIAYLAANCNGAADALPKRFMRRYVSGNSFIRLGLDLTRKLQHDKPDLIHVQYTAPLRCPVPVVTSVHDVSFLEHPEYFPWARTLQLRLTVKRTIQSSAKVITPSEFSRRAILSSYGLEDSKVAVVPIAVSSAFRPIPKETSQPFVQCRFRIDGPFILTVGDLQPRKNQIGLIRAFEKVVEERPDLPHHLVIVGQNTWYSGKIQAVAEQSKVRSRIHFTEFVTDEELVQLYNACEFFVFPSFYEGFGLPILEAMACGRAVACSNTSAMPEVANAAALMFDPSDTEEMSRAIRDLLVDSELRTRMERLGQHRAATFTWERTARKTLDIYYEVAGGMYTQTPDPVISNRSARP